MSVNFRMRIFSTPGLKRISIAFDFLKLSYVRLFILRFYSCLLRITMFPRFLTFQPQEWLIVLIDWSILDFEWRWGSCFNTSLAQFYCWHACPNHVHRFVTFLWYARYMKCLDKSLTINIWERQTSRKKCQRQIVLFERASTFPSWNVWIFLSFLKFHCQNIFFTNLIDKPNISFSNMKQFGLRNCLKIYKSTNWNFVNKL